jgi:hypothetical protein
MERDERIWIEQASRISRFSVTGRAWDVKALQNWSLILLKSWARRGLFYEAVLNPNNWDNQRAAELAKTGMCLWKP